VPADDLSAIPGLADKHRRVLARRQITTFRALAHADRRHIHKAMASIRPRPTLELIARWQDSARSKQSEAVLDTSDWHTAASFAVVFAQRQIGGTWQRRLEVERTEVEPERDPEVWPGWDCSPVCGWMLGQLGQLGQLDEPAGAGSSPQAAAAADSAAGPADEPAGPAVRPAARTVLSIDRATVIDAVGTAGVAAAGVLAANPPTELIAPVRVVLKVGGAPPGHEVRAVVRFRGHGQQGWNPQDPVIVPRSGKAEFDLSQVPAGQYQMALLAWAPDASAKPASVTLPMVTIHHEPIGLVQT
jgi:hypothetical protein